MATESAACAGAGLAQADEESVADGQRREQHLHSPVSVLSWTSVVVLPMHTRSPPVSGQRGFEPDQWREVHATVDSPVESRSLLRHLVDAPHGSSSHRQNGGIGALFHRHDTLPHASGRKLGPIDPWRIVEFFGEPVQKSCVLYLRVPIHKIVLPLSLGCPFFLLRRRG